MKEKELTSHALAYLGDCVLELKVREYLVKSNITHSSELNRAALSFVTAVAQSEAVKRVLPLLREDEEDVFRRGKNSHVSPPKSATLNEYKRATGFECVLGYLHLRGEVERIDELFCAAYADKLTKEFSVTPE